MNQNTKVALPSGAELEIMIAPFAQSRALYQAILEELKDVKLDPKAEVDVNFIKDLFCAGLSSKKIEEALGPCLGRATYNKLKITNDTWEPKEARQDYMHACFEVAKENVAPFMKTLTPQLSIVLERLKKGLA